MKYESIIEDYQGHYSIDRFETDSDEKAIDIVNKNGFNHFSNDDCLWRVQNEYVDYPLSNDTKKTLFNLNYIKVY